MTKNLDLQHILNWLIHDGILSKDTARIQYPLAQSILKNAPMSMHPLTALAQCKLTAVTSPGTHLNLDWLSEWLARRSKLPFYRIDPLKVDFTKVADVMSATYAARFNILPVEISPTSVTIATCEPGNVEWHDEIAKFC